MNATGKRRRKLKRYRKPEDWADDAALEALARDYQRRIREASTQEIEAYAGVRSGKILLPLISPGGFSAVCAPSNRERCTVPIQRRHGPTPTRQEREGRYIRPPTPALGLERRLRLDAVKSDAGKFASGTHALKPEKGY